HMVAAPQANLTASTPARDRGAPTTREEADGTPPARPRPASKLGIHLGARAAARRTDKTRILRAVDRVREFVALRALLRFLRLSPSRFHAWRRLEHACALDDQSSCPHASPRRLTPREVQAIKDMVTALEYRHAPTGTLAVLAQRLGKVWASPSTGITWCASSAGAVPGSACTRPSQGWPADDPRQRDMAHRHHRH